ncbi:CsbD family protein [Actinoalloteichus sp. AHMU CJ021]|uniref:CsbD-like n=1 Tax=Actinoalloteichus caeruleus DSM 43889 TaxID=1120930 RepID=A0ABT1JJT6_ACTCY|nr:CsbD family protein [Actinoalloteichus caeruleus]AUS78644.1 CsbD family protein [Actinoalloteichus sp. AHMU CJ021]MCP2332781.1 CsbD-like [Actinoalloteichus caeruleus DSM 43889]
MSVFDKAKHGAQELAGKAKEALGRATDNEEVENSGKKDKLSGQVKKTGEDAKDRAAGAVDDAKKKFGGND